MLQINKNTVLGYVDVCLLACFCYTQKASLYWQHLLFPTKQALREPCFLAGSGKNNFIYFRKTYGDIKSTQRR